MKRVNKIVASALILAFLMYLPGCIGQEAETITETVEQTETRTEIQTVEPTTPPVEFLSPYIGSGKLDGNGIPVDFFTDIDVRKGFAHCMDWDTLIDDVFLGEAVQPATPIIDGLAYHNPDQVGYTLDLAKAEEHFKKAWNGEVWEKGFRFTITYNIGNEYRRVSSEVIKRNAETINEKFTIYVRGVPWPTFLSALVDGTGPMFAIGWLADYPDPHNFAHPFMHSTGDFSHYTHYSNPRVDELIEAGIRETDLTKRQEIYYELQQLYVEDVPSIPLYQPTSRYTAQEWIQGWYHQPIDPGPRYHDYTKAAGAKNRETFITSTIGGPETVDPAWSYDTASGTIIFNVYETLIKFAVDPDKTIKGDPNKYTAEDLTQATDQFVPVLAKEVPTVENGGISADGLTYTFHLKEGIKFENGADMTAEDVEYSIERGMVMDRAGGPQWMFYEPLLGIFGSRKEGEIVVSFEDIDNAIEVVDDYTIRFNLAIPYGPLLTVLAQGWGSVLDKDWAIAQGCWDGKPETWKDYNNPEVSPLDDPFAMMTTGPFKFENFETEVEWSIVRNENYRGEPAFFKRVITYITHEWAARKLRMLAGDTDFCSPETVADAIELGKVQGIVSIPGFKELVCGAMFFNHAIK